MRHEQWRNELSGNEVAVQIEVAEQFGAVVPVRSHWNHGESTIFDRGSNGFREQSYKARFPCARVASENDKWLGAKRCIKTAHRGGRKPKPFCLAVTRNMGRQDDRICRRDVGLRYLTWFLGWR